MITCQDVLQCAIKGNKEEEWKLVNMDVNNSGFKIFILKMFNEEGNALNMFVRVHTMCFMVRN